MLLRQHERTSFPTSSEVVASRYFYIVAAMTYKDLHLLSELEALLNQATVQYLLRTFNWFM